MVTLALFIKPNWTLSEHHLIAGQLWSYRHVPHKNVSRIHVSLSFSFQFYRFIPFKLPIINWWLFRKNGTVWTTLDSFRKPHSCESFSIVIHILTMSSAHLNSSVKYALWQLGEPCIPYIQWPRQPECTCARQNSLDYQRHGPHVVRLI